VDDLIVEKIVLKLTVSMRSLNGKHARSVVVAADTSIIDSEIDQREGKYLNGWYSHLCVHTL
jgi:hypothetical protein